MLPAMGSISLEGPLDDKCVPVPGGHLSRTRDSACRKQSWAPRQPGRRPEEKRRLPFSGGRDSELPGRRGLTGGRPASSLPLAWHEIDCRLALRVSDGRVTPAPRRPLALASPPPTPGPDGLWHREQTGTEGLGARHEALDSPAAGADCSAAGGAVGEMLGLEVVRWGLRLNGVTGPYCFNSAHPASCARPRASRAAGQQEPPLGTARTAHRSPAGRAQRHLPGRWHQPCSLTPPCSLPGFLPLSGGYLPSSLVFSEQVSLLHWIGRK